MIKHRNANRWKTSNVETTTYKYNSKNRFKDNTTSVHTFKILFKKLLLANIIIFLNYMAKPTLHSVTEVYPNIIIYNYL